MRRCSWLVMVLVVSLVLGSFIGPASASIPVSLIINASAQASWARDIDYGWNLEKTVLTGSKVEVALGQTVPVTYQINVIRTSTSSDALLVQGEAVVENHTGVTTQDLTAKVQFFYGSDVYTQVLQPTIQLPSGAIGRYPFSFQVAYGNASNGQLTITVTTTNYPGYEGVAMGPNPLTIPLLIPSTPVVHEDNATADLVDLMVCPAGFTCTPSTNTWTLQGSAKLDYTIAVLNTAATCGDQSLLVNTATLVPMSGIPLTSGASVTLSTGVCAGGCTATIGYWKNHTKLMAPLLPINLGTRTVDNVETALDVLNMRWGSPSNGITKLYAQLLAAKLNMANGASALAINEALASAEDFLAVYTESAWDSLSRAQKQQVLEWAGIFDDYNNGLIGPGHCM